MEGQAEEVGVERHAQDFIRCAGLGQFHHGGVREHAADDRHDDGVRAQAFGGGEADEDGQEEEHRVAHRVDDDEGVGRVVDDVEGHQQRQDPLDDSRGSQQSDDGDHRRGDHADDLGEAVLHPAPRAGRARFVQLAFTGHLGPELVGHRVVNVFDVRTDDDLVLATGADHVDDAVEIRDKRIVGPGLILEVEAHAGDAVGDAADVARATDARDDVPRGGVVAGERIDGSGHRLCGRGRHGMRFPGKRDGHRVARRHGAGSDLEGVQLLLGVGHDDHGRRVLAGLGDGRDIHGGELVAGRDGVALGHRNFEGAALQLDGVDAEVDEELQPLVGADADGVAGLGHHDDGAAHRRDDIAAAGVRDGETVSHLPGGEDGIVDVTEVDDLSVYGGKYVGSAHGGDTFRKY